MCAGPLTSALPNHRKELERRGADNTEQPGFAFAQSLASLDLPGSPDSTTQGCVSAEIGVSLKIPTVLQHVLTKIIWNHMKSSCIHRLGMITQLHLSSHPRTDHQGRSLLHHAAEGHAAKALQALLKARSAFDRSLQKVEWRNIQITSNYLQNLTKNIFVCENDVCDDRRVYLLFVTCDVMFI